jgi:predicted peptidase
MKTLTTTVWLVVMVALVAASSARGGAVDDEKAGQQTRSFEKEITIRVKLNYLLYLPEGYESSNRQWPMVLFLHGGGETGENIEQLRREGLPKVLERNHDFPFVVVSPQSRRGGWNTDALNALLDEVITNNKIDQERVYLTGLSMGGSGTWEMGCTYPERFAAIAPICGGGSPARAKELKNVAVWAFHGAKDRVVPVARTEAMIKALKEAGCDPKLTIYPDAGHDAWTATYDNPELYTWFLEHKRSKPKGS